MQARPGPALDAYTFAFSPDGQSLAMAGHSNDYADPATKRHQLIQLWNASTGKRVGNRFLGKESTVLSIAYSPDGKILLGDASLWDVKTACRLRRMELGPSIYFWGNCAAFSGDGKLVASSSPRSGQVVGVWEVATGQQVLELPGHIDEIRCLAFASDGQTLISGSADRTILLWDLQRPPGIGAPPADGRLPTSEVEQLWLSLGGGKAAVAYSAICRLSACPLQTADFLGKKLPAAPQRDTRRIRNLITELDSDEFAVREAAMRELGKLGYVAEPELRDAVKAAPSLEVSRRARALLGAPSMKTGAGPPTIQQQRAVQILERIGSRQAREVLQRVVGDRPLAGLSREAAEALKRLEQRSDRRAIAPMR